MSGILTSAKRPRNLTHWHAGPLLFGDWGTSRLYVLGIGAVTLGLAAPYYLLALSVLMAVVAWAYTIVCRSFPDGGGVYSAARQISPLLSVIGATLLLGDYIVTASLSTVEAFAYFGVPDRKWVIVGLSAATIAILGLINWFGARSAGELAKWIAIASIVLSAVVAVLVLPWVPEGLRLMKLDNSPLLSKWVNFTGIILALSGVEAVANMTGIMKEPVQRTAAKTIWPVLGEVAILNVLFGVAMLGLIGLSSAHLPELNGQIEATAHLAEDAAGKIKDLPIPDHAEWTVKEVQTHAMKVLAVEGGQKLLGHGAGLVFGKITAIVFGLLLLSATNTVIGGMISVMYALGRDNELPRVLTKLNYSGVPRWPLVVACVVPVALLCIYYELEPLSHLYAIGVTGAISLNLSCCAFNKKLAVNKVERIGLFVVATVITLVFITIAITKHSAALFAGILVINVLIGRQVARLLAARAAKLPEPEIGWLAELQRTPLELDPNKPRIMLAARGRHQAEYAVDLARKRGATLFAIYVRTLRVLDYDATKVPRIEEDPDAQEALGTVAVLARQVGVPFVPIYCSSPEIAEEILDYTVTFGCDTLIMGKSRRTSLARQLEGDVVATVATMLPEGVSLVARDALPHGVGPEAQPEVVKGKAWEGEDGRWKAPADQAATKNGEGDDIGHA
jgi:amino acid transporter/nucleotide-binding universal stress UspA family protein